MHLRSERGSILLGVVVIALLAIGLIIFELAQWKIEQNRYVRDHNSQERLRLQKLLVESIDCDETLRAAGINPSALGGSCGSTGGAGQQVGPFFPLKVKKVGSLASTSLGGDTLAADGSFVLGDFAVRASCSATDNSLVVRARPLHAKSSSFDDPYGILIGKEINHLPDAKFAVQPVPLCTNLFSACRVVRYKTFSSAAVPGFGYAKKPVTLPSNVDWVDRDLFATTVDAGELSSAALMIVSDEGIVGAHTSLYRTPTATELAAIKSRFDAGMSAMFFADNGVSITPSAGDGNRGTREILAGITNLLKVKGTWANDFDSSGTRTADTTLYPFLAGVSFSFAGTSLYTPSDIETVTHPAACVISSTSPPGKCRVAFLPKQNGQGEIFITGNAYFSADQIIKNFVKRTCPPPTVVPSDVDVIAGGPTHTCVLRNGGLKCTGFNSNGQLGKTGVLFQYAPQFVTGFDTGVTSAAVGNTHTCAVKNGEVFCWGYNNNGQVGDGTSTNRPLPVKVQGLPAISATQVAAGYDFSCALVNDAVYCWGYNSYSQLGNGSIGTSGSKVAVPVTGLDSGVTHIAASGGNSANHACAIKNGALYCWGANGTGQLGRGSVFTKSAVPTVVNGLGAGVEQVVLGDTHTCAIVAGSAKCWGTNSHGGLGNGNNSSSSSPVQVTGMTSGVKQLAAGYNFSCALDATFTPWCWGYNGHGELGVGNSTQYYVPRMIADYEKETSEIGAAFYSSFVVKGNKVYGSGYNAYGHLGTGGTAGSTSPVVSQF